MSVINQKEYLKKYLSIGKDPTEKKKKKRKKIKTETTGLKIIDDNVDTFKTAVQEDLLGESEDAPQIVEIIDDRPPSLRVDEKSNMHLWIPIGGNNEISTPATLSSISSEYTPMSNLESTKDEDMSLPRRNKDADISPPRRNKKEGDISSLRNSKRNEEMSQLSRKRKDNDISPLRRNSKDADISPPRKNKRGEDTSYLTKNKRSDDMLLLLRNRKDNDVSPSRTNSKYAEICSPVQNKRVEDMSLVTKNMSQHLKSRKDDLSPPRRKQRAEDLSPPKKIKEVGDMSPLRRDIKIEEPDSPPNSRNNEEKPSTTRNKDNSDRRKGSRWDSNYSKSSKMMKTLDGKSAGLQNARELGEETREIKRKEEELFKNLPSEVSGANASTIVRNKKTGKIRNLAEEAEKDLEKLKKKAESEEKYSRWGKGLKQVEDAAVRRADAVNEMNKPLARYADDEDLERYLKEQEREGDPMLAYIRKRKKKQDVDEGKPMKPEYMGEFMPNRFGVRPGHRWDGVDRSNGYEKRWFEVQNSRLAQIEETYKWSTEDM